MKNELNISNQARLALVKIGERRFRLKDPGVFSTVISNWRQHGLLMKDMISEDKKLRKINKRYIRKQFST